MLQASEGGAAEAGDSNRAGYNPNGAEDSKKRIGMLAPSATLLGNGLASLVAVALASALAAGCGFGGGADLTLGYLEWDENVAVSSLTKVLLEEDLGYENVELKLADDVRPVYRMVASGEADAFQDTWMPNQEDIFREVEDDVELLDPWFKGTTRTSIATPSYMNVTSIAELNGTGVEHIIGIEAGSPFMDKIAGSVIPRYDLEQELVAADTPAMLAEVEKRYRTQESFAFVAWSPHWMNDVYDFDYLSDPKGALGELTKGSDVSTLVREGLAGRDPTAYALMERLELTEDQVNSLEVEINEAKDPPEGARRWLEDNRVVVEPWVEAARDAQGG